MGVCVTNVRDDIFNAIITSNKFVIVDFFATWWINSGIGDDGYAY